MPPDTAVPELVVLPGSVMVSGRMLPVLDWAAGLAQKTRNRNGLPPSPSLARLLAGIERAMSAGGQADVRLETTEEPERQWVTTAETARRLGCSTRHARRLAERLGGTYKQGRWQIDVLALLEHQEGKR